MSSSSSLVGQPSSSKGNNNNNNNNQSSSSSSSAQLNVGLVNNGSGMNGSGSFGNNGVIYENFPLQGSSSSNASTTGSGGSNKPFHSPLCSQWHRKYPLLAISKANGVVSVYDDHGDKIERVNLSRSSNCTALGWHPSKFILCTGWKDGVLLLYNDKDHHQKEIDQMEEHGRICCVKWSPDGERLITTHQNGNIGIWKFEGGKLKHLLNYENPSSGSIVESADQIVFKTNSSSSSSTNSTSNELSSWIFFIAVSTGQGSKIVVGVADDLSASSSDNSNGSSKLNTSINNGSNGGGSSSSSVKYESLNDTGIQFNGSQIMSLLFHREKSQLVLITDTALLVVYKINAGGSLKSSTTTNTSTSATGNEIGMKQVMRTKISLSNSVGSTIKTLWVGSGVIATITGNENMVRVWNLETDENTTLMLPPPQPSNGSNSSSGSGDEVVLSFSFNPHKRAIVAGTSSGRLIFWVFTGNQKTRDQWEKYGEYSIVNNNNNRSVASSSAAVSMVSWGCGEKVLCYGTSNGNVNNEIEILQETSFKKRMKSSTIAIQNSLNTIIIGKSNHLNNSTNSQLDSAIGSGIGSVDSKVPTRVIKTGIQVRDFDHTDTHLIVSNGNVIELFELRGSELIRKAETFEIPSLCVGLHSDSIFVPTLSNSINTTSSTSISTTSSISSVGGSGGGLNSSINSNSLNSAKIEVYNFKGIKKQTLQLSDEEGIPICIDIQNDFITIATNTNHVRMWHVLGREAKPVSVSKKIFDNNEMDFTTQKTYISSVKTNCNGTMLALLGKLRNENEIDLLTPSTCLYVYDFEHDKLQTFNFESKFKKGTPSGVYWDLSEPNLLSVELKTSENDYYVCTLFATQEHGTLLQDSIKIDKQQQSLVGQCVPNLFFVKNNFTTQNSNNSNNSSNNSNNNNSSSSNLNQQQSSGGGSVIDLDKIFEKKSMKDFEGIDEEQLSSKTKRALLNFSFYLNIGSMEEAYKSVKQIESKSSIWYNMAKMCVKTRKMEISEICLGNMKNALAARALRKIKQLEPNEPLAWIATLAIQLGMVDEAEKLYQECERYDLLNEMYQSIGNWERALEIAKQKDRIHLKTTHYKYGRFLEMEIGDLKKAEKQYELSNTHKYEVPRMYYACGDLQSLQNYILSKPDDRELNKWWAQYCEGNTDYEEALKFYVQANDYLSQVRMYCFIGNLKMAADIVKKSQEKSAAYYFAKQLEMEKENRKLLEHSIKYYKFAGCFSEAIRVAKLLGNDSEALNLALQSANSKLMIQLALYFESNGNNNGNNGTNGNNGGNNGIDKAVLLYQKGGNLSRAIDLCFKHQLFETLSTIADNIFNDYQHKPTSNTTTSDNTTGDNNNSGSSSGNQVSVDEDPEVFMKCGQFFIEHQQYERAVQMYIRANEYELALELCVTRNVKLTEEMADQMSPSNNTSTTTSDDNSNSSNTNSSNQLSEDKISLLRKIAKVASMQNNYSIATKKYVQAGDKSKAMKILIKSGDTEKIMLFAVLSRQKQLYIQAANYLQSLDWHNEPEIIKSIISFYTKAKAWKHLSVFFELCSQVEIDEYRDYEKALDALKESSKYLSKEIKQKSSDSLELRLKQLNQKILYIEKFILAKSLMVNNGNGNETQFVTTCRELIDGVSGGGSSSGNGGGVEVDDALRVGDVYAILIEYYLQTLQDASEAYKLILEMKQKEITLNYFIDDEMIRSICKLVGVDFNEVMPPSDENDSNGREDDIQEEIDED